MSGIVWAALKHSAKVVAATNAAGFLVTAVTQSHKITDLTGTAAFAASAWATHAAAARAMGTPLLAPSRGSLLAGCVSLWALRLGGYLFYRVLQVGKDARLDQFFQQPEETLLTGPSNYPLRLLFFWTMQGLWAWACMLPVTAAHALSRSAPAAHRLAFSPSLAAGLLLFGGGLLVESVADWQKFSFKSDPANQGRFMGPVGLFAYSRHPNYFGEMCVWAGLFVMAGPAVWVRCPWAAASPIFTYLLIRHLSGIPPLERSYAERYGGQPQYEAYKAATNLLFPWPPRDKFP
ncbi:hypothetical protein CHLNCDRAFT_137283 [Chlorella variabilis]|uniref:Uncharacterized protein n=1 Tax=Chlorella variabilis TaxID=554065 RepID=E1ZM37_CHLVA|nr:hypothetical protein CHLNCDRAFT_137283 [Chlorella variabilis]EFN53044.1 hypothetical protein CHLNCDRAFT_137283 [Chlorella variabilis]|eukprot:XP_005845146.1 hypothetical protein CHLNCDRAFT_137283 [Chlorella variabilis]